MKRVLWMMTLAACQQGAGPVSDYELPLSQYSIGEYLQVEDSETIVTANRSPDRPGLVRVNLREREMTVLDSEAKEARDIFSIDKKVLYRVNNDVRLFDGKPRTGFTGVSRLRSFHLSKGIHRATFDTLDQESRWKTFYNDGKEIAEGPLPGSGRSSFVKDGRDYLVFQNSEGLYLGRFGNETDGIVEQWLIEKGTAGLFATAFFIGETLYVVYFDDDQGILKLAKKSAAGFSFTTEVVDGNPGKSYVGIHAAPYNDHNQPAFVYGDGIALKLRRARLIDNHWVTEQLPILGATGFYTHILSERPGQVTVITHNFRSNLGEFKQSFEDIAVFKLKTD